MTRLSAQGVPRQRTLDGKIKCSRCGRMITATVNGVLVFHSCRPS